MEVIIEDFERGRFYCDLEIDANWNSDDCEWSFSVVSWRNRVCNPKTGNNKTEPAWKKPNDRLAEKLAENFEGWFYSLYERQQDDLLEY